MAEVPVKVYVRVRPLLEVERLYSSEECVRLVNQDQLVLGSDRSFRFDYIFHQDTPQSTVYEHCVSPLLSSCLDGYNATVLAYGQTGSGKSFTLGSEAYSQGYGLTEYRGVIPRALDELFNLLESCSPSAETRVAVSYIEIYKEELRDLLDGGGVAQPLVIRENDQGNTVLHGAVEHAVLSAEDALSWLEAGNTARVTAATQMNQRSSRSHAVFTLHIEQRWKVDQNFLLGTEGGEGEGEAPVIEGDNENTKQLEQCVAAKFHFVDLAGSERVSRTGNRGERFKESVHINTGLLALGNVISALGDPKRKSSHVPYRESKITRLLKDSLGGNARTSMIACLSPAAANFAENLNTLKYAKRARNIRNRPVVNKDAQVSRLVEMREEIAALRDELYRTQVASKPTTATTVATVDSSVMVELSDVEGQIVELEAELREAKGRCQCYHHALSSVRELLGQINAEGTEGGAVMTSDLLLQIKQWLEHNKLTNASSHTMSEDSPSSSSSLLTERAMETIRLLRREVERCQIDLQTDEELFAEKTEELGQLQMAYNLLLKEKETLEVMWLTAQENEGLLESEVFQLREHLAAMARQLAEKEGGKSEVREREEGSDGLGLQAQREEEEESEDDSLKDIKLSEVFGELESSSQHQVISENGEREEVGVATGAEQQADRFGATRSLLRGKVSATTLQDFTAEAIAQSMLTLNTCLAQHILTARQTPQSVSDEQVGVKEEVTVEGNELRPTTPLETSLSEPSLSRSTSGVGGHAPSSPTGLGGTYRLREGGKFGDLIKVGGAMGVVVQQAEELELLNESALESKKQLTTAEEKLSWAEEEHRNLKLKIRLKEELIRELVKSSKSMKQLNESYLTKIHELEKEASRVQRELQRTQNVIQKQKSQSKGSAADEKELMKLVEEHKKKLSQTEKKLNALQRKQKEAQRLVQSGARSDRRIDELESGIERLRNQQEMMKRRLKKQTERKLKLENDLQKYEVRIKSLQAHSEQQSKVLRRKTEEAAVAQRKLRQLSSGSRPSTQRERGGRESERVWLDEEVERVLQRKKNIELLEKELMERQRIIAEKEALLRERDELEAKKIRCSHTAARDIVRLSQQINTLEDSISLRRGGRGGAGERQGEEVARGRSKSSENKEEITKLMKERDELVEQCDAVRKKVHEGMLLPVDEERRLYELNEHIEILEATINFKNSSISSQELHFAQLVSADEDEEEGETENNRSQLTGKLQALSLEDARELLIRYFHKVVRLHLQEGRGAQRQREMEVELEQRKVATKRLERSLRQTRVDCERELLSQQKEHEKQVQLLIEQLAETEAPQPQQELVASATEEDKERIHSLESKIKVLEKDLFYYKKTSRELKKKLQSQSVSGVGGISSSSSGGGGATKTRRDDGGMETKTKMAVQRLSCQDATVFSHDGSEVTDSLEISKEKEVCLTISGTSLVSARSHVLEGAGIISSSNDRGGQAPPTGCESQQMIRKQKKQLRQLSASDVAALKQRKLKSSKDTSDHQ